MEGQGLRLTDLFPQTFSGDTCGHSSKLASDRRPHPCSPVRSKGLSVDLNWVKTRKGLSEKKPKDYFTIHTARQPQLCCHAIL